MKHIGACAPIKPRNTARFNRSARRKRKGRKVMKTYINITKYVAGKSVREQINELLVAGKIDENTRLFFSKGNCITTRDIAELEGYFDIRIDHDFDDENIVFVPRRFILARAEAKQRW